MGAMSWMGRLVERSLNAAGKSFGDAWVLPDRSTSMTTISRREALSLPAVHRAVRFLARGIANLPLTVVSTRAGSEGEPMNRALERILNERWNDDVTGYRGKYTIMEWLLCDGDAYVFIQRDDGGRVVALWPLSPQQTRLEERDDGRHDVLYQDRTVVRYGPDEVVHLRYSFGADGVTSTSPLDACREAIALYLTQQNRQAMGIASRPSPTTILSPREPISGSQAAQRAFENINSALDKNEESGRNIFFVPEPLQAISIGTNAEQLQVEALRRFQLREVARIFGVNPVYLFDDAGATYSNAEQYDLAHTKHELDPWSTQIEQAFSLRIFGGMRGQRIETDYSRLERADKRNQAESQAKLLFTGQITPNEARAMLGHQLVDEPGADSLWIQGGAIPIQRAWERAAEGPEPAEPEPAERPGGEPMVDEEG